MKKERKGKIQFCSGNCMGREFMDADDARDLKRQFKQAVAENENLKRIIEKIKLEITEDRFDYLVRGLRL